MCRLTSDLSYEDSKTESTFPVPNYTFHRTPFCLSTGIYYSVGRDSSVGIATGYGLDGAGIESQWRVRFSAPIQIGPGAHPASCTMDTGPFTGVKSGRGVTLAPHPF